MVTASCEFQPQPAAARAVWQLTQGQLYCIQLIGQEVIERLNKQKRRLAAAEDVEAVLPTVFERGSEFFLEFWRSRSKEEQTLLAALATGERVTPEMTAAAPALVRKEVLVQEQGGWAFKVPLLGRWVGEVL